MKLRALVLIDFEIPDGGFLEAAEEQTALQVKIDEIAAANSNIIYHTIDMRERRGDTQPDLKKMKFRQT
jgi:hypothetical protein